MTFRALSVRHYRRTAITVLIATVAAGLVAAGCSSSPAHGPAAQSTSASSASASPSSGTPTAPASTGSPGGSSQPVTATAFQSGVESLSAATRARMTGVSWRPSCPLGLDQLRLLHLSYWGFDNQAHSGELIVNASAVTALTRVFSMLYAARYPIRQMRVVDDFGGSDERSMTADNTSAFNCRVVPGSTSWSMHAYGLAVDINPFENPMMTGGQADPPMAAAWADRTRTSPAIIRHGDAVWQAFRSVGWFWGGDWTSPLDYQHFSSNGN